jgi:putative ABC transport system permease protein
MSDLMADVRHALRVFRGSKGTTALIVMTLALGIGANTAVFSVIRGVLLKPLPYDHADRLVVVEQATAKPGGPTGVSIKEYKQYREQAAAFESLVEYHQMSFDLLKRGEPSRVNTGVVSHDFFEVLGIRPLLGRTFRAEDDRPGADAVLVLSNGYWRARFGADPGIVGQVFEMNGRPHTVVGVLPDVPLYPQQDDVYMPVLACPFRAAAEATIAQNPRSFGILRVFGRLRAGTTQASAAADVATVAARFTRDDTRAYRPDAGFTATARDVGEALTANARPMLLVLLGTTALVLLLACANVSNLTLARVMRRERELAVRAALGAGRARLVRLLVTESVMLSLAGGVLGLGCAAATLGLLTTFTARFTVRTQQVAIDPAVLLFSLGLSAVVGIVFGIAPALMARVDLTQALNEGTRGNTGGASRRRLQGALVVAQVAVSVVLLSGAGLLLVSVLRLQRVDPGYRAAQVLSAEAFGNFVRYADNARLHSFYAAVLDRLQSQPGVQSVAVTNAVPLSAIRPFAFPLQIEGTTGDGTQAPAVDARIVSPRYFETLGVPLLQGRDFTTGDRADTLPVAIVNQSLAQRFGDRPVVGSRVSLDGGQSFVTVVGVVADMRMFALDRAPESQLYVPYPQDQNGFGGRILLRSSLSRGTAAEVLRTAVRAEDPDMPIENVRTVGELRDASLATPKLTATLLLLFAGLALSIAVVGITGVIAASVSERTQEFGVRMALGAQRGQVLQMVLRQGLSLVASGVVIGVLGSLALGRLLATFLYETRPADPGALAASAVVFTLAGVLACLGPALRATSVDPLVALRG